MIKTCIFDLDGTLLNTLDDIVESMNSVLHQHGFPIHDSEAYKYFVGDGIDNLVQRALPEPERSPEKLPQYIAEMRDAYRQQWDRLTRPYPGIPDTLDELQNLGCRLTILTNKPQLYANIAVEKFLGPWSFDSLLGQQDDLPKKPDPQGVYKIMEATESSQESILYIGDTNTDMHTAQNAGVTSVGVTWGFRPEEELRSAGAHYIIHSPDAVIDLVKTH